jgi:hypothetical protein
MEYVTTLTTLSTYKINDGNFGYVYDINLKK